MDHSEAVSQRAVELYFLGELRGEQRDAFEEHYMSCPECAQEVRIGAMFMDNAREVLRSDASPAQAKSPAAVLKGGWFAGLLRPAIAVPVFAVLLAMISYQSFVAIPRMQTALSNANAPRALSTFSLLSDNSRGGSPLTISISKNEPFALYLDIPPQPAFSMYTLDIDAEGGALIFTIQVSAAEARNTVELLVPGSRLRPGQYDVVVSGAGGTPESGSSQTVISHSRFTLETH